MSKINYKEILDFYGNKRVLITGNTGFKGSWLTHILLQAGAEVIGFSLCPPTEPSLFKILDLENRKRLTQIYADVRDIESLRSAFKQFKPEIVFHLAAQPIVRESFMDPVMTYSTNIMGTVNICEAIRTVLDSEGKPIVYSFLNVTTDKVYRNNEWEWGYRETDILDGLDPYSNSKSCSELVTHSYKDSFFKDNSVKISTARAGNVIGGGDFSKDRIIPDCVRALLHPVDGQAVVNVRNPYSTRPYEHVLEPLFTYMMIAAKQYGNPEWSGYYNVGPDDIDCVSTGDLVAMFTGTWNRICKEKGGSSRCSWVSKSEENAPQEANFLKLDCSKLKSVFCWKPTWHIDKAIVNVIEWTRVWLDGGDIIAEMDREISEFVKDSYSPITLLDAENSLGTIKQ